MDRAILWTIAEGIISVLKTIFIYTLICFYQAVLASVIVVALKGMLMQITAIFRFWKLSKMDAAVWLVTFLTVVFVSIDIGLLLGVIMSLLTILILGFKPYTCLLGSIPHTDLYLDVTRFKGVRTCIIIWFYGYSNVVFDVDGSNSGCENLSVLWKYKFRIKKLLSIRTVSPYWIRTTKGTSS